MRKKLLAIPFCLMLFVIPVALNTNKDPENSVPNYENGVCREGPFPEGLYVPPETVPNVTCVGPPPLPCLEASINTVSLNESDQRIQVAIYLAVEENFYYHHFYTPYGMENGFLYALMQMNRVSKYFEQVYNVQLVVVGSTTWHQDKEQDIDALYEVYQKTGFQHNKVLPNGYVAEVLVAWTLKLKYGVIDTHGITLLYDPWTNVWYYTCIMRYCAYWMDDNLAQHEISHLLNATDGKTVPGTSYYSACYYADCVMSYRCVSGITTVNEDGIIWTIPQSEQPIGVTFLTNNWCADSQAEMNEGKWLYAQRDYITPPLHGDC
jgi:hypothetical protein